MNDHKSRISIILNKYFDFEECQEKNISICSITSFVVIESASIIFRYVFAFLKQLKKIVDNK